jgi:hypothetical protein
VADEVADAAVNRMGAVLEQLAARFDLVLEAVSGFGGRLEALREEIVGQFTEVGRQIRFLSDRIAENRETIAGTRADLGAEMIRVGEALGATRVEFRESLASARREIAEQISQQSSATRERLDAQLATATAELHSRLIEEIGAVAKSVRDELAAEGATDEPQVRRTRTMPAASADALKKIDSELKQTNKSLASLMRKFERFDDRITVQTRDQDQRIRKLERRAQR